MRRRSACVLALAFIKTAFASSFVLAAQEAARTVARIAGPRWNVNGDWAPTMEEMQRHLREAHGIDPGGRGMDDLLALHDNDHNRRGSTTSHGHRKSTKGSTKGYAAF